MKHLKAALFAALLAVSLAACEQEQEDAQEDSSDEFCFDLIINDSLPHGFEYWEHDCEVMP